MLERGWSGLKLKYFWIKVLKFVKNWAWSSGQRAQILLRTIQVRILIKSSYVKIFGICTWWAALLSGWASCRKCSSADTRSPPRLVHFRYLFWLHSCRRRHCRSCRCCGCCVSGFCSDFVSFSFAVVVFAGVVLLAEVGRRLVLPPDRASEKSFYFVFNLYTIEAKGRFVVSEVIEVGPRGRCHKQHLYYRLK